MWNRRATTARTSGHQVARDVITMTVHNELDRRPGPLPEIQAEGDSLTFRLTVHGIPAETQLVLRCDAGGNVWAAIATRRIARGL